MCNPCWISNLYVSNEYGLSGDVFRLSGVVVESHSFYTLFWRVLFLTRVDLCFLVKLLYLISKTVAVAVSDVFCKELSLKSKPISYM